MSEAANSPEEKRFHTMAEIIDKLQLTAPEAIYLEDYILELKHQIKHVNVRIISAHVSPMIYQILEIQTASSAMYFIPGAYTDKMKICRLFRIDPSHCIPPAPPNHKSKKLH